MTSAVETSTSAPLQRPARVLIVDDHPIVRQGYAQLIGNQPDMEVCGFAATENEALLQVKQTPPDLAVIDITLKDSYGISLIQRIHTLSSDVRMLVVSAHDENLFAERVLEAGALGYINKQEATDRLIQGIRSVLKNEIYVSEGMTRRLIRRRLHGKDSEPGSLLESLSNREFEVFQLIGQGMATRQIASHMHLSPKTIERYKENLKEKLHLSSATELVQRATRWILQQE